MSEQQSGAVVVAVGRDPMDAALKYAVDEATRHRAPLRLVHVVQRLEQGSETLPPPVDLEQAARELLEAATTQARRLEASLDVTTDLVDGAVVPTLVRCTQDARVVVLQRRQLSRARRMVTRSVSSGVAARARVPVVSVPARWSPVRSTEDTPVVTVGIDDPGHARTVLEAAVEAARVRGAQLHVVHAWVLPGGYEGYAMSPHEEETWARRSEKELTGLLGEVETTGLEVQTDVVHGHASEVLREQARESDLLVLGRHDPLLPLFSHLGPVARAMLREVSCPVLLVDPS
ncbi:universal stress protein [Nocardioides daphniae]|uniref:Universal stress protein n=1 Tax=Nocardioides daphniae TaxID=402297 RepID=A0A4P7UBT0_9ACTN|nr:universal stress protein [Nocardioides daphniae]QCC77194.1 universal stress protein [Nocardioides daphniae]GGD26874.1 universal stress protein [Nocardioides daphniae]